MVCKGRRRGPRAKTREAGAATAAVAAMPSNWRRVTRELMGRLPWQKNDVRESCRRDLEPRGYERPLYPWPQLTATRSAVSRPSTSSTKSVPVVGATVVLSPLGWQCNCHPNAGLGTGNNLMDDVLGPPWPQRVLPFALSISDNRGMRRLGLALAMLFALPSGCSPQSQPPGPTAAASSLSSPAQRLGRPQQKSPRRSRPRNRRAGSRLACAMISIFPW